MSKEEKVSPKDVLKSYAKTNKSKNLLFTEGLNDYGISSGSLILDLELGGLLKPAIYLATGISGGGKSSATLSFMSEFLKEPNRMAVYFQAERLLSDEHKSRTDIRFIESNNIDNWEDQTCYLYRGNIYEDVTGMIRELIDNNPNNTKFFFVIDSMNALIPNEDLGKSFYEARKVAGGALLASDFLRRMSLKCGVLGHYCFLINQVRSTIKINVYDKTPKKLSNNPGAVAMDHYADAIFEFQKETNADYFYKDASETECLGRYAVVILRKNKLENKDDPIRYPLKFGVKGKNIIWKEREIHDMLIAWEHLNKDGAWLSASEELKMCLNKVSFTLADKFHSKKFLNLLEEKPDLSSFLFERCKNLAKCGNLDCED